MTPLHVHVPSPAANIFHNTWRTCRFKAERERRLKLMLLKRKTQTGESYDASEQALADRVYARIFSAIAFRPLTPVLLLAAAAIGY